MQIQTASAAETARTSPAPRRANDRLHFLRIMLTRPTFWAFLGSLLLAAIFGRVTLLHLGGGIMGGRADGYENLWNDYWVRTALFHLHQNPFFSGWIEYPLGTSLRFHTLNPFGALLSLPVAPLVGGIAAMNLKILFALVCCTFFAYLLIRDLTGSPLASFAGATVYTYANDRMVLHYLTGTENYLMGGAMFPLYCFFLLRAASRPRWRGYAAASVATLLALALTDWQYTLFAILFTLLFFVVAVFRLRNPRAIAALLARLGLVGGVWVAIVGPTLLLPMFAEGRREPWLAFGEWQAPGNSKALIDFVRPGYQNPGYFVLIVMLVGLALFWRRADLRADRAAAVFWAIVAGSGLILSLGPNVQPRLDRETAIPLPYAVMTRLPLLSISRKPFLFYTSFAMLGIGVLLAFALRTLLPVIARWRVSQALTPRATRLISGVFVSLLLVGTLLPTLRMTREGTFTAPDWPKFYTDVLAQDPDSYAILETPLFVRQRGRSDAVYQAFQIVHHKYRFGSSVARDHKADNPDLFIRHATLFRDFFNVNRSIIESYRPANAPDFLATPDYGVVGLPLLNFYHVRYIVLYTDALDAGKPGEIGIARALVTQALGPDAPPV
ncbi:MAG: hypothetical protein M3176_15665, partial [Chloroflexota bacterium]|nr:hypothetical protein [Chloroflexota bacterium]